MVKLEKRGKPATGIVSRGFEEDASMSAQAFGLSKWPFVYVPHVLTGLPDEQIRSDMAEALDQVINNLTNAPGEAIRVGTPIKIKAPAGEVETFEGADHLETVEKMDKAFLDYGIGDGFPLVAPTPERVKRMLGGTTSILTMWWVSCHQAMALLQYKSWLSTA